jgi:hypothetical protein
MISIATLQEELALEGLKYNRSSSTANSIEQAPFPRRR